LIAKKARSAVTVAAVLAAAVVPAVSAHATTGRGPSRFTVVAHLSTHSVRAGHSATIGGSVAPVRPGKTVYLQQERFGTWSTIRTTKLNGASEYSFTVTPLGSGTKYYRVTKLREGAIGRASSPVRKLSSYRWFRLDQLQFTERDGIFFDPETINGTVFQNAMYAVLNSSGGSEFAVVELGRACTSVRGTLGLTDVSDPSSQADIAISVDGAPRLDYQPTPTDSEHVRLSVSGARQLRVDLTDLLATTASPAIGGGQALCAFDMPPVQP
jgi:hypothetical protein